MSGKMFLFYFLCSDVFDMSKNGRARAFPTICCLQIHAPGSDHFYSGEQQLSLFTQNILHCSTWPKGKVLETECKQRNANPQMGLTEEQVYTRLEVHKKCLQKCTNLT